MKIYNNNSKLKSREGGEESKGEFNGHLQAPKCKNVCQKQKQRDRERRPKKITPSCCKMLLNMYAYTQLHIDVRTQCVSVCVVLVNMYVGENNNNKHKKIIIAVGEPKI